MERDLTLFPQDNVGDALWQMVQAGDDLSQPREIQFSVLFQSKDQALKYGQLLLENQQKLSLCPFPEDENYPWEITAYPEVEASYENIAAYQELLENSALPFQGKYDGWYSVNKGA